jgi:hypothetical protein
VLLNLFSRDHEWDIMSEVSTQVAFLNECINQTSSLFAISNCLNGIIDL